MGSAGMYALNGILVAGRAPPALIHPPRPLQRAPWNRHGLPCDTGYTSFSDCSAGVSHPCFSGRYDVREALQCPSDRPVRRSFGRYDYPADRPSCDEYPNPVDTLETCIYPVLSLVHTYWVRWRSRTGQQSMGRSQTRFRT